MVEPVSKGRLVGYARLKTDEQELSLQIDSLTSLSRANLARVRRTANELSCGRTFTSRSYFVQSCVRILATPFAHATVKYFRWRPTRADPEVGRMVDSSAISAYNADPPGCLAFESAGRTHL
jgi:hypothetical protein